MPTIEVSGKPYETDEEGYLVNLGEWNEDVAQEIAKQESIDMNENHWEVVNFLRRYYEEYQIAPAVRVLTKAIDHRRTPQDQFLQGAARGGRRGRPCVRQFLLRHFSRVEEGDERARRAPSPP